MNSTVYRFCDANFIDVHDTTNFGFTNDAQHSISDATSTSNTHVHDHSHHTATPWMVLLLFLIPYITTLIFALPRTNIGSKTYVVSVIHRLSGINTLMLPLGLMLYEAVYQQHAHIFLYLCAVSSTVINCIFGALLIPKRIHAFDIPTIRAFVVGVMLGLSFVCLSLNFRFGHLESFENIGRVLAVFSLIGLAYAINDAVQHTYRFLTGPKLQAQIDFGFFFPSKNAHEVGLDYRYPSLWEAFVECCYKQPTDYTAMSLATVTPSNFPVVYTVTLTALFGLANLMQIHYLKCGHQGMEYRNEIFPKITQMSAYGWLLAATANNFGTFAGTLVVKRVVCTFWGAFFNAVGLLIPVCNILFFMYRFNEEESMIASTLFTQCNAI
eukprot:CAMPEP_0202697212 /NCGR_PEP_ID=MMETSP1385-20130828/10533_1 /ASSEMBLY_ACC=CAM_ASM_000861 /TAXON_ID=933848 /ORGANISM="Elphidium margaritaceum" /LENGTH=381 /DNA_ID=CAMNT_0049353601 /DNA_START=62 /DNA_END=1207 /DNA_ORIENTATION=-